MPPAPRELDRWSFGWYVKDGRWYVRAWCPQGVGGIIEQRFSRTSPDEAFDEALRRQCEFRAHGQLAALLTDEQRVDAARCIRICEPFGVTPLVACEEYAERHKGTKHTFRAVVMEVVALKREKQRSPRYCDSLKRELLELDEQNPGKLIGEYTTADLERELRRHPYWQPTTMRGAKQNWNVVFNHAVKFEYRQDNPCSRLELPRVVRTEPAKLSVEQVRRGLAACLTSREMLDCLAWFVLGNFAGLRPEETERLRWEQVSFDTQSIVVLADTSKKRQRRVVTMQPVLTAWLRPLFRERGLVMPAPLKKVRVLMRSALRLARWPSDVLRHNFGSYHYYKWHNLAETRFQMGHGDETPAVFFDHYCSLVEPPNQDIFWDGLSPPWQKDLELAEKYLRDIGWRVQMQLRTLALPAPAEPYDDGVKPLSGLTISSPS